MGAGCHPNSDSGLEGPDPACATALDDAAEIASTCAIIDQNILATRNTSE